MSLFTHHIAAPGRIEHQGHFHLVHVGHFAEPVFHIAHQYRAHAAVGGGEGHADLHHVFAIALDHIAAVDQTQFLDAYRNLRVEDGLQGAVQVVLAHAAVLVGGREVQLQRLLADGVCVGAVDACHVAIDGHRVGAAQGLAQIDEAVLGDGNAGAVRHLAGRYITLDDNRSLFLRQLRPRLR